MNRSNLNHRLLNVFLLLSVWILTNCAGESHRTRDEAPPENSDLNFIYDQAVKSIPAEALQEAINYYQANNDRIRNRRYLTVIDFSRHSGQARFHILDMKSGAVESLHTSHGKGSDPDADGVAQRFSNLARSNMTSLGFYLTNETYVGKHGLSLRLDGLQKTNSNARQRAVVIHGARYVSPTLEKMGRSWGCPALSLGVVKRVISQLKGGSLLYAYHPSLKARLLNPSSVDDPLDPSYPFDLEPEGD